MFASSALTAKTVYVSLNGSNSNDGLSEGAALRSVQIACDRLDDGDTLIILPGTYHQSFYFDNERFRKTVKILGEGEVIFDGEHSDYYALTIEGSRGIIVSNIEVRNYNMTGINVLGSNSIVIQDCTTINNGGDSTEWTWYNEGYGINAKYSSNVIIRRNIVMENGPNPEITAQYGSLGTGINTYELENSQIVDNITRDNRGGGILVEDGFNVVVTGNESTGHRAKSYLIPSQPELGQWWCGGIWIDGGSNITVRNNTFSDNIAGVYISNIDEQVCYGFLVDDNTVSNNRYGMYIHYYTRRTPESVLEITDRNHLDSNERDWFYY